MSVFALLERLTPHIEREVNLDEAESLSEKLRRIQVGLREAERIGVTEKGVKDWLKNLQDVVYDMDDVLDEFETTNLHVEAEDTSLNWEKPVRSFLLSICSCFKQEVDLPEITLKMKALSMRIDSILTKKGKYSFKNDHAHEFKQEEESTPLVSKEFKTYGLKDVKNSLIRKLVIEVEGSDYKGTQIISIVGVGGVGKSTLARVAYNDPDVDSLFSPKGWVSVSQAFDALATAKAILESFGEESDDAHDLETLVQRIKKAVDNKRFLLVLDNVWAEDRNKWESLRNCLDGGKKGSRIVVTTRHESVARMMDTTQWQSLGLLSDLDCRTILNGVALEGRTGEEREKLEGIGVEITKKCNGLPLAARSLGSMLALKSSEREWSGVLESPLWKDGENVSDLFRLLNLSYTDLSPLLKRCFLSSAVFPKGTAITIDEISRIWMAYGYLNSNGSVAEVQIKGFVYFNNLAMRSFFQRFASDDDNDVLTFVIQDKMHDFATYLSGSDEYSFIMDGGLEKEKSSSSHHNLPWNSLEKLRTFSVCREELRPDIISHLTSVRVLSMNDCNLEGLPEDIGKLIHLRYLNVSHNPMSQLPETITDLHNLQTLDIGGCVQLSCLPEGVEKLIKLRHIVNSGTVSLLKFPQGLEKLSGLWTLSEFRGGNLGRLRNLNQIQGSLLLDLVNLNEGEVGEPELWKKKHLKKLVLIFRENEEVDQLVEALRPPPNLECLEIYSGWGKWLSHWLSSFDNLKSVSLSGRGRLQNMPPFGKLPALEELEVFSCAFERLSNEFLGLRDEPSSKEVVGGFPRLKKLRLFGCARWQEWEDIEEECVHVMRCLEELEIKMCPGLYGLPRNLLGKASSLRVVKLTESQSLYRRYNKKSGYDRHNIPLLPNQRWTVQE